MKFMTSLDMVKNEIKNLKIESLSSAPFNPVEGQIYFNTTQFALFIYANGAWKDLSSSDVTKADLAKMTSGTSGATMIGVSAVNGITGGNVQVVLENLKNYIDSVKSSLDIKQSVRVATTDLEANLNIDLAPLSIDGVALAVGNRVLVKNGAYSSIAGEATGSPIRNGIYTVTQLGASAKLARASDADSDQKVNAGMFTFVQEGELNSDNGFVLSTNENITLNVTPLEFTQFSGAGKVTAGDGLIKNGDRISVVGTAERIVVTEDAVDIDEDYAGQESINTVGTITTGQWQGGTVGIAYGGTGATTAQAARQNLGATTKFAQNIGDGLGGTTYTINHNLGTQDVVVLLREAGNPYAKVEAEISFPDNNNVLVTFSVAPTTNQYRIIIIG